MLCSQVMPLAALVTQAQSRLPTTSSIEWTEEALFPWTYNGGVVGRIGERVVYIGGYGRRVPEELKQKPGYFDGYHRLPLPSDTETLRKAAVLAIEAGNKSPSGLVRDRLKTLTAAAIRCLTVRTPKGAASGEDDAVQLRTKEELLKLVRKTEATFADRYFGQQPDLFWNVILRLERDLNPRKARQFKKGADREYP